MASERSALLELAESVADGSTIDWGVAELRASDAELAIVRQLRVLATLGMLHRTLPEVPDPSLRPSRSLASPAIGNWGHLSLLDRLGGGTFGDVYRAWDAKLEREVALKLLRKDNDPQDPNEARLIREARLLARIRHQNVVTVYGVDTHNGQVALWMEMVRGSTLEERLTAQGVFRAQEAALIGIDLCHALTAIHGAGLLHRDVKAQNVMLEEGGRIVLMDLGTGREMSSGGAQEPGDLAGTPLYLAPEIFAGNRASVASDLYSLGVLLYRLVTGAFPVRATTMESLREAHTQGAAVPLREARPDLPEAFTATVDRALARDPAARYDSAAALEADLARVAAAPAVAPRGVDRPGFLWPALILAAAVVLLVGLVSFRPRATVAPAAADPSIRTIAVLPLRNDSGDPSQEYFADGMTDEIISTLGRLEGLTVISRTSSMQFKGMQFKGAAQSLPEIAKALKADAVVEGSVLVLPAGAARGAATPARRVRISARLIAAGTDTQIWNQTFETIADNVLSLEAQVAKAIADGIRLRLPARQQRALAAAAPQGRTPNFEAFNLYLRGRYYWNQRTKEGLERSVQYFSEAIERDAAYAAPHAGLADAYVLLNNYGSMPFEESLARASAEASKALAIDNTVAEAHASLGLIQDARLDWAGAEASFRRAISLNPGYTSAHHWYAAHLARMAAFAEATAEIERAIALDPLSVGLPTQLGAIRLMARDYDGAIAHLEKVVAAHPGFARAHFILAQPYAKKGAFDRALAATDRAAALGGGDAELRGLVGCILAAAGRGAEARAIATELIARYRDAREGGPVGVAAIYATLRENDRAFEWLERAREQRDPLLGYLKVDPWFDEIRADPRFETLLARLGLTR